MSNKFFAATKAEESGYSDPFGDSCPNNFDIVQFINDDLCNTPVDSPADSSRFLNVIQQQQHQQQLILQSVNINNQNGITSNMSIQNSVLIDNGIMYANNANGVLNRMHANSNSSRLPDSPPITDISAGGLSSASPSSGDSASGDSPFSPPSSANLYNRTYHQNGVLFTVPNNGKNSNDNGMLSSDDMLQHQMQLHQRIIMQQQQRQMSPQSEFLSPYPPSQSTPGSQHSSLSLSQVSPPGLMLDNQRGTNANYLNHQQINQQQQYGIYNDDDMTQQQIQQSTTGGYKRRRTNMSGLSQSSDTTSPTLNSIPFNNIKCENGIFNRNSNNILQQQQNCNYFQQNQQNVKNNNNANSCSTQQVHSLQPQPPPPPSSHHSLDGDSDNSPAGLQKTIKFSPFLPEAWPQLYDGNQRPINNLNVHIVADKGFNFSTSDKCFVNQKKNHFQITVHIDKTNSNLPYYFRMANGEMQKINDFLLVFGGAKHEMPNAELVPINQSRADRKPVPHEGVKFNIDPNLSTKLTVQRLHFSLTTLCNHRKSGKPNPDQKYFFLISKIMARTSSGLVPVQSYQSEKVIVRASNPGQFEQPETETQWQRNEKINGNVLHFNGQVAVGTDTPVNDAKLTVKGNIFSTGAVIHPSDRRVKENISNVDTNEALSRISQMRIVEYAFKPEIAKQWGLSEESRHRVGVIAQELEEVLPDAVRDNGEFLTVDDTRIFYDTVAAAQELYRLTGNLECKIDQVEKISQKLARFAQKRKNLGSLASGISDFSNLFETGNGLASVNKSYMSYSRTSLSSAPAVPYSNEKTFEKNHKSKRVSTLGDSHKRCRTPSSASSYSYCHKGQTPDNTLCTSKVTQGTIVTLVVIMALCLMAMCTLYVMDWYNRTYIYAPHHHYHQPSLMGSHDGILPHKKKVGGLNNRIVPDTSSGGGEFGLGNFVEKIIWTPSKHSGLPLAGQCSPLRSHCPVFCCGAPQSYLLQGVPTKTDLSIGLSNDIEILKLPKLSLPILLNFNDQQFKNNALESGVKIQVLNLNVTLDSSYCRIRTGCNSRKGFYQLDIPVSPFLPTIPLLLDFKTDHDLYVNNCDYHQDFEHKLCKFENDPELNSAFLNNPISKRISGNIFELPVGSFMQSAFVFRIGHTSDLCQLSHNQLGRSFDEYRIVFYRTCGNIAQTNFTF